MERKPAETPDIREKGGLKNGQPQVSDRRLFVQLLVWTGCSDTSLLVKTLARQPLPFEAVLYEHLSDPSGVALLTFDEDPDFFVTALRRCLRQSPFDGLTFRPELAMFGRTYSLGYEPDLEDTLFSRPRRTALNPDWPWAIWYPLRRSGRFVQLPETEQRAMLMEHGRIGHAFGQADYAHDIRLMCYGLDVSDNDFVIGLVGKELHPLSAIVQAMRKTQQTSLYLEKLGPFFVGKAVWRSQG
jgi:hypothetical protein